MLNTARKIISLLTWGNLCPEYHPRWIDMPPRERLAARGELLAERKLRRDGFSILERRWRWHRFELDLVASKGNLLVVAEVKTRQDDSFGSPQEAVPRWKQQRISIAGQVFQSSRKLNDYLLRFDVIAVTIPHAGKPRIEHIENAFSA